MPDIDVFDIHAQFCKVFANPLRQRILWHLGQGECTVSELAEQLEVTVSNTSQHLRMMRALGVVQARRDGQKQHYSITSRHFLEGCRAIRAGIAEVYMARYGVELPVCDLPDEG